MKDLEEDEKIRPKSYMPVIEPYQVWFSNYMLRGTVCSFQSMVNLSVVLLYVTCMQLIPDVTHRVSTRHASKSSTLNKCPLIMLLVPPQCLRATKLLNSCSHFFFLSYTSQHILYTHFEWHRSVVWRSWT